MSPETLYFTSKCTKKGGSGKWEREWREMEMEEEGRGEGKGRTAQCLKCIDAHADLPIIK